MKNIAFIGLGVMGFPMAGHLVSKNNDLNIRVYNRSIGKSEKWLSKFKGSLAKSPAEAAEGCDIVFMCVGNDKDVEQVVRGEYGIMSSIPENAIIADHTTASAKIAIELNTYCKKHKNVCYVDAPVSGGQAGAENGALAIMVGGEKKDFDIVLPYMNSYAKAVTHMGGVGNGQLTKMVNQICIAGLLQSLSEGLNFAKKSNLDPSLVLKVISQGAASSWQMINRGETMVKDSFDFGFAVEWMVKDLEICINESKRNNSEIPVTELVNKYFKQILAMNGSRWDTSSLIKLLRN